MHTYFQKKKICMHIFMYEIHFRYEQCCIQFWIFDGTSLKVKVICGSPPKNSWLQPLQSVLSLGKVNLGLLGLRALRKRTQHELISLQIILGIFSKDAIRMLNNENTCYVKRMLNDAKACYIKRLWHARPFIYVIILVVNGYCEKPWLCIRHLHRRSQMWLE